MALCFFAVGACIMLVLCNLRVTNNMRYISSGCISPAAREAVLDSVGENISIQQQLEKVQTPMVLYHADLHPEIDLRGVYITGNPGVLPPLLKGRFFNEQDNYSDTPRAVIGKDYEKDTFIENGKQMITIQDVDFEVIGVAGIKQVTRLDAVQFINFGESEKMFGANGNYLLDTATKRSNSQASDDIKRALRSVASFRTKTTGVSTSHKLVTDLSGRTSVQETTTGEVGSSDNVLYVYLIILIAFILCTLTTTVFWMRKRNNEMAIERMLGLTKREMLLRRLSRYLPIGIVGSLVGVFIVWLLYLFDYLSVFLIQDILFTVLGTVLSGTIILIIVQLYFFKHNLAQELR